MWPNAQSWNWNSVDTGPGIDLLGAIMNATRSRGLHAGLYFSLYEWYNPIYRGSNPEVHPHSVYLTQEGLCARDHVASSMTTSI